MQHKLTVLGLESSCDDTAAAVVRAESEILSNIVISQNEEHVPYKGVVPEIAARAHLINLEIAIDRALSEAGITFNELDGIAATCGPGLIGGVIISSMYGKALASSLSKPFIAINHLEGHALTARLTHNINYPYLLLLVSGGHCQFIAVHNLGKYEILGLTLDDAVGEVFDKVAKMLGLGFPGGPILEKLATAGDEYRFNLPRPLWHQKNCNMSFSGLKTAVSIVIQKLQPLQQVDIFDVAASFQHTVCEILKKKTQHAMKQYEIALANASGKVNASSIGNNDNIANNSLSKTLVIAGGVAANLKIRASLQKLSAEMGYRFVAPPIKLCTDNATMIAFAGLERLSNGIVNSLAFRPRARWSLDEMENC